MSILLNSSLPLPIQFIQGLFNAFKSFFDLVVSFLHGTVDLVYYLISSQGWANQLLVWLPGSVLVIVAAIIVVVVLYKVLGREG